MRMCRNGQVVDGLISREFASIRYDEVEFVQATEHCGSETDTSIQQRAIESQHLNNGAKQQ